MIQHPSNIQEYRLSPAANQSSLKHMMRTPRHYKYAKENPKKPTDDMNFGSLCDSFLFGTEFTWVESQYAQFRTDASKEWKASMEESGIAIFQPNKITEARTIVSELLANDTIKEVLSEGMVQPALFGELHGVQCKALLDFVSEPYEAILDLKVTGVGAGEEEFKKHASNMDYDFQAAFYVDLHHAITGKRYKFAWIVAESDPPYCHKLWVADDKWIEGGRRKYTRCLHILKKCMETNEWPGYPETADFLTTPHWYESNTGIR